MGTSMASSFGGRHLESWPGTNYSHTCIRGSFDRFVEWWRWLLCLYAVVGV